MPELEVLEAKVPVRTPRLVEVETEPQSGRFAPVAGWFSGPVFSRARDIFAANMTELLDRAEDPARMIRMIILEMEETLVEIRATAARSIADIKEMRRAVSRLDELTSDWTGKAELALSKGRDDLAMGLLHDVRHFQFDDGELKWDKLNDLPLGLLSKGMHYRQSVDLSFRSRGLDPLPVLESDSTFQLIQAIGEGMCCAIMPLNCGLETLSEHLRITPIAGASIHSPIGLLQRRTEPRSALAEKCFAEARTILAGESPAE